MTELLRVLAANKLISALDVDSSTFSNLVAVVQIDVLIVKVATLAVVDVIVPAVPVQTALIQIYPLPKDTN